jgi:hypothetical protein
MQSAQAIVVGTSISAVLICLVILGDRVWKRENERYPQSIEERAAAAKRVRHTRVAVYCVASICCVPLTAVGWLYLAPHIPVLSTILGGASGCLLAIGLIKNVKDLKWDDLFPPRRSPAAVLKLAALGLLLCSTIVLLYPAAVDPAIRQQVLHHLSQSKEEKN